MQSTRRLLIIAGAVTALVAGGTGTAIALSAGDDGETQATGSGADQARAAALAITHGGTANAVERDSENGGTWEVEVTRTDGTTVDVRLDEHYGRVAVEVDSEQDEPDD
jgi:hypothetical protein